MIGTLNEKWTTYVFYELRMSMMFPANIKSVQVFERNCQRLILTIGHNDLG